MLLSVIGDCCFILRFFTVSPYYILLLMSNRVDRDKGQAVWLYNS